MGCFQKPGPDRRNCRPRRGRGWNSDAYSLVGRSWGSKSEYQGPFYLLSRNESGTLDRTARQPRVHPPSQRGYVGTFLHGADRHKSRNSLISTRKDVVTLHGCDTFGGRQHAKKGGDTNREIRQNRSSCSYRRSSSQPRRLRPQAGTGTGSEQRRNVQIRTE